MNMCKNNEFTWRKDISFDMLFEKIFFVKICIEVLRWNWVFIYIGLKFSKEKIQTIIGDIMKYFWLKD